MAEADPLPQLRRWLDDAVDARLTAPWSVAFITVGGDGRPSARTVTLKRLESDALLFTSALWTRKAVELAVNPHVALLFHWPALGRQAHLIGQAAPAERELSVELFAERDLPNRLQTLVSRQGEPIADLEEMRARRDHLARTLESPPACPEDWGAIRFRPSAVELWSEADDRLHDRLFYAREGTGWVETRIAP